jgi:nicotinamide-nucleotide amidase
MTTDRDPQLAAAETDAVFPGHVLARAAQLIDALRAKKAKITFAESCTGGLLSGVISSIAGASDVFDAGFVTYSNTAKTELLGISATLVDLHGAVSADVAIAMADGARRRARSSLAIAVTGIAGPGGGSAQKPVGLVFIGVASANARPQTHELRLGDIGRASVRLKTVEAALALALAACAELS